MTEKDELLRDTCVVSESMGTRENPSETSPQLTFEGVKNNEESEQILSEDQDEDFYERVSEASVQMDMESQVVCSLESNSSFDMDTIELSLSEAYIEKHAKLVINGESSYDGALKNTRIHTEQLANRILSSQVQQAKRELERNNQKSKALKRSLRTSMAQYDNESDFIRERRERFRSLPWTTSERGQCATCALFSTILFLMEWYAVSSLLQRTILYFAERPMAALMASGFAISISLGTKAYAVLNVADEGQRRLNRAMAILSIIALSGWLIAVGFSSIEETQTVSFDSLSLESSESYSSEQSPLSKLMRILLFLCPFIGSFAGGFIFMGTAAAFLKSHSKYVWYHEPNSHKEAVRERIDELQNELEEVDQSIARCQSFLASAKKLLSEFISKVTLSFEIIYLNLKNKNNGDFS